ncbi:hypothetical protein HanIR_Chr04g0182361 [Helianthus annuus]|nr:hypothetical protein HanIR_Chr04g0182361 [Helianthus annuus]
MAVGERKTVAVAKVVDGRIEAEVPGGLQRVPAVEVTADVEVPGGLEGVPAEVVVGGGVSFPVVVAAKRVKLRL